MMRNNLTGIIISALLHLGVLGWIVSSESIKQPIILNTVALTVSMFQTENVPVVPPAPPVIKKVEKIIKTPEPIKVAALSPTPKIKPAVKKSPTKKPKKKIVKPTKVKATAKRIKPKKVISVVKKKSPSKHANKTKNPVRRISQYAPKKPVPRRVAKKRTIKKPVQRRRPTPKAIQKRIVKRLPPVKYKQYRKTHVKPAPRRNIKPRAKPQNKQYARKVVAPQRKKIAKPSVAKKAVVAQSSQNRALTKQYKARLQQLIASNKRYPKRAKRRGHQGRVTLSFRVTHSGNIVDIKIIKGANNNDLNNAAIKAIQKASGKLSYIKGMNKQSLTLTVTLAYTLS